MLPACCCRGCATPRWWPDNQAVIVSGVMRARLLLSLVHDTEVVAGQPGRDRQRRDAARLLLPLVLDADAVAGQPGLQPPAE